jgi:cation:H+ antiporter
VAGAADIASAMGVSSLVIGLTLVSIGTSAPEILVSATAALKGVSELAVGNALGSNLANTGLVLAVTALIVSVPVSRSIFRRELAVMLVVTICAGLVLYDGYLGRWECVALVFLVPVFLYIISQDGVTPENLDNRHSDLSLPKAWLILSVGLLGLIGFSDLLVRSAVETASRAGVSELIIGATVVAVGTSLPELAASLTSAFKGKTDIALGNVLGSNIFNLLLVLPIAGMIHPTVIEREAFVRDFGVLMLMSLLLTIFCFVGIWLHKDKFSIGKIAGAILLFIYILYYYVLFG